MPGLYCLFSKFLYVSSLLMLFATCLPVHRKNPVNTYKMYECYDLGNVVNIQ